MIPKLAESRRFKILWIPEAAILGVFDRVQPRTWIRRPYFALPKGTTVNKTIYSPERQAFGFLLHNPIWEAVPINEIPPDFPFIEITLEVPKICEICGKTVPINEFCDCVITVPVMLSSGIVMYGLKQPNTVDNSDCEKSCPKCDTKVFYFICDCPNCHYKFDS